MDTPPPTLLVMGAGAIGCWLGGCLQAAGVPVVFVGRARVLGELRTHGLTLTDLDGRRSVLAPS
ncbi:MAG TPA: 2-dehydropantoate 2-reductase N-terminal domain-containing protein, partial [Burkholderiaceae bacterium]|nr:2-dehydropantoate 2-reductase N-terminal domain-containing protein [Burkholderiaceae bacterium]